MNVIETGLQSLSKNRLSNFIKQNEGKPLRGIVIGTFITAVLQSSSAVTVMLVGAVDAGFLRLKDAVYIIMGANIGTSVTAWIVSLSGVEDKINPISLYPVLGLVGIGFILICKNIRLNRIGMVLIGFTLIMSGINGMSSAVLPLSSSETFINFLTKFDSPLLGILAGTVTSAITQSSSAGIGILQALSTSGEVTLLTSIPIILGQNIGTCVTAGIAAVGSGKNAKGVAFAHLLFNITGAAMWTVVFYLTRCFLPDIAVNSTDIALIHTLFNVTSTVLVLGIRKARFARISLLIARFCAAEN